MTVETADAPLAPPSPGGAPREGRSTPPGHDDRLAVEIRTDLRLSPADLEALHGLVAARPHVGVFLSPAWLSAWCADLPGNVEPRIAILRGGGTLRGIAPLAIIRDGRRVRIRLVGGGGQSDRTDLLAERAYAHACADALLAWICGTFGADGFVLELRDVPHDSALWAAMSRLDAASRVTVVPREMSPGPYLDLRELRNDIAAPRGPAAALHKSLARHRRWLEQRGHLRIDVLRDANEAIAAFETLVRLLHERWEAQGGVSALDNPSRQQFHRRAIPLLLADGHLRMVRVSVDLRTVAVIYALSAGDWWGCVQLAYDREWAGRIHLGKVAFTIAMEVAAQGGATQFDFLKGSEPVKYIWPVRERITVDADVYSACAVPQLARARHGSREVIAALTNVARHACRRTAALAGRHKP